MSDIRYYTTTLACSCPDFFFRGRQRPCKHVVALRDAHALINAQEWYNELIESGVTLPPRPPEHRSARLQAV